MSRTEATPRDVSPNRALLAFCLYLAHRSVLLKLSYIVVVATVLGFSGAIVYFAKTDSDAPLSSLVNLSASALSWGAGATMAFGAALYATRTDVADGLTRLLGHRGVSLRSYALARTLAIAAVTAGATLAGMLCVSLSALSVSTRKALPSLLASIGASALYTLAFSVVFSAVALAALGGRSRLGGYGVLLLLFIVPDLLSPFFRSVMPEYLSELCSIPSLLTVLRASVQELDIERAARAILPLCVLTWGAYRATVRSTEKLLGWEAL